jgi:membrane peptidoglycan carboxypeptidase
VGFTPLYSTAVWTGHPLSRESTGFGGPTSGPIWRSFMEAAQGSDCPDFDIPSSLPELSSFHGSHTSSHDSSSDSTTTSETTTDETTTSESPSQQAPPKIGGNVGGGGLGPSAP